MRDATSPGWHPSDSMGSQRADVGEYVMCAFEVGTMWRVHVQLGARVLFHERHATLDAAKSAAVAYVAERLRVAVAELAAPL